jgi:long-chain acyl-CoA synthetase
MLSHNNLVWNAMNAIAGMSFSSDTTDLHSGPMFHLADGASTFGVTACGGTHAFVPRFDPVGRREWHARDHQRVYVIVRSR